MRKTSIVVKSGATLTNKSRSSLHRNVHFATGPWCVRSSFYIGKHSAPTTASCLLGTLLTEVLKEVLREQLKVLKALLKSSCSAVVQLQKEEFNVE